MEPNPASMPRSASWWDPCTVTASLECCTGVKGLLSLHPFTSEVNLKKNTTSWNLHFKNNSDFFFLPSKSGKICFFPQQKWRKAEPVGTGWWWEIEPRPLQVEEGEPPTWWVDPQVSVEQQILACEQFFLHQVQMRQPPERGAERLAQEALREETMELLIHCSLDYVGRSALLSDCCNGGKLSSCYHHGYCVPAWASTYLPKQQN